MECLTNNVAIRSAAAGRDRLLFVAGLVDLPEEIAGDIDFADVAARRGRP